MGSRPARIHGQRNQRVAVYSCDEARSPDRRRFSGRRASQHGVCIRLGLNDTGCGEDLDEPTNLVPKHRCRIVVCVSCQRNGSTNPSYPVQRNRNVNAAMNMPPTCAAMDLTSTSRSRMSSHRSAARQASPKYSKVATRCSWTATSLRPRSGARGWKLFSERPAIWASLFPECRPVRLEWPVKSGASSSSTRWRKTALLPASTPPNRPEVNYRHRCERTRYLGMEIAPYVPHR